MTRYFHQLRKLGFVASASILAACAPTVSAPTGEPSALPPIPSVDGPLDINVVHPTGSTPLPDVDSTYIYGSVGTGDARLAINGTNVPVYPNGAFLAYLPVPETGTYILESSSGRAADVETVRYVMPEVDVAPNPSPEPEVTPEPEPAQPEPAFVPQIAVVSAGADTLITGSDVAIGRPSPSGTYKWFLPEGARMTVVDEVGDQVEVRLDSTTTAWFPANAVTLLEPASAEPAVSIQQVIFQPQDEWLDVIIPAQGAPFLVNVNGDTLEIELYGTTADPDPIPLDGDALIATAWIETGETGNAVVGVELSRPVWGYKAFYSDGGDLVLRLRRPPEIDPTNPLQGLRIAVDAGHPPGGATGPTGLTEAEANLSISLALADQLRQRGAEVMLTRPTTQPVGLEERVDAATAWNADLLISVHNNAFAEGVNPFENHGSSVYYFHPFAADIAETLVNEISQVTGIPNRGAIWSNLALARPTWMPSVLTESLFMLMPRQESALRNAEFVNDLAAAHVRGIERAVQNF